MGKHLQTEGSQPTGNFIEFGTNGFGIDSGFNSNSFTTSALIDTDNNAIARFDGTSGVIKNSTVLINDTGDFTNVKSVQFNSTLENNVITDSNSNFRIDLFGTDNGFNISADPSDTEAFGIYGQSSWTGGGNVVGAAPVFLSFVNADYWNVSNNPVKSYAVEWFESGGTRNGLGFLIADNSTSGVTTRDADANVSFISSRNSTANAGIVNSVMLGGTNDVIDQSNTAFANELRFNTNTNTNIISSVGGIAKFTLSGFSAGINVYEDDTLSTYKGGISASPTAIGISRPLTSGGSSLFQVREPTTSANEYLFQAISHTAWTGPFIYAEHNILGGVGYTTINRDTIPVVLSGHEITVDADIVNSVSLGGVELLINKSNTAFAQNLEIQNGIGQYTVDPTLHADWGTNSLANKGYVDSFTYFEQFTPGTINVANTITHNLGSTRVLVELWDVDTDETIGADRIKRIDENTLEIYFTANPTGDVEIVIKK